MTLHLDMVLLLGGPNSITSNNRGESEGNLTTLQKIHDGENYYAVITSDSLGFALRRRISQLAHGPDNDFQLLRKIVRKQEGFVSEWGDLEKVLPGKKTEPEVHYASYADMDIFGFMYPDKDFKRKGALNRSPAISLRPWNESILHHFASKQANNPSANNPTPFSEEAHLGYLQTTFSICPEHLEKKEHLSLLINAIKDLGEIAGNQSSYKFDASPKAVVFNLKHRQSCRVFNCFDQMRGGKLTLERLEKLIDSKDVGFEEGESVIVGGFPAESFETFSQNSSGSVRYHRGIETAFADLVLSLQEAL